MEQGRNSKEDGEDEQAAVDFGRVHADENGGASDHAKGVVTEAARLRIGKDN